MTVISTCSLKSHGYDPPLPTGRRTATIVEVPSLPRTSVMELGMKMKKGPVPVTALSPSAVSASTTSNALATKIILTALFVAVKHTVDETLCFLNCH